MMPVSCHPHPEPARSAESKDAPEGLRQARLISDDVIARSATARRSNPGEPHVAGHWIASLRSQ
jgi:hypothetical protein